MVALRDGRKLVGILRSWDQFGMGLPRWRAS
jgi:small nuclear ribonucleoprotein (snRNP)-like protein